MLLLFFPPDDVSGGGGTVSAGSPIGLLLALTAPASGGGGQQDGTVSTITVSQFLAPPLQNVEIEHVATVTAAQQLPIPTQTATAALSWPDHTTVGSQLIYPAATGLEKAQADVEATHLIFGIDAELIIDTWDPYDCPYPLLPYLAWAMGVNFWNDDWSETTKRAWTADQWAFKALRGSADGIDMVVDYAGRDVSPYGYAVTDIIVAPQKLFPGPSISAAERMAWLESLPQVRQYLFQEPTTAIAPKFFIGTSWLGTNDGAFAGTAFDTPSTASERFGLAADWFVDGVQQDVPVTDFGNYFQLHFYGNAGSGMFMDTFLTPSVDTDANDNALGLAGTGKFLIPSTAWKRLTTIEPQDIGPYPISVGPSMIAVSATPQLVAEQGSRGYGMFCGSDYYHGAGVFMAPSYYDAPENLPPLSSPPVFPSFLVPSTAKYRLYNMYAVYTSADAEPTVPVTPATMFCGFGRFGFPPFTAEIDVAMPGQASPGKFWTTSFTMPSHSTLFTFPHDPGPLDYVCSAIEAARRMIDKCLLNPNPEPEFVAGAPFIAGIDSYVVGQAQVSVD